MARLPTVLARSAGSPVGVPNVQVTNGAIAGGLGQAAEGFGRLAEAFDKQAEQDGRLWASRRSIELRVGLQREMQNRVLSGENVDGLGDWAATATDEAFRTAADAAPNDYAKQYLGLYGADTRGDLLLSGDKQESDFKVTQRAAEAEDTLNTYMNAAMLGGYAEAEKLAGQFKFAVDGMALPQETRAKMERGTRDILAAAVRGQIDVNPSGAINKIEEYMSQGLVDAADGATLINAAHSEMDRREAKAIANAARADQQAAKAAKLAADDTAKRGFELQASGQLDPEWVLNNRDTLDPSDYRILLGALNDPTDQKDVVADMYRRIYLDGEDAREEIIGAVENSGLSAGTAKTLLDENMGVLEDRLPRSPIKVAREYLKNQFDAFKGALGSDGYVASAAFGEASRRFEEWVRNNPDATDTEISAQADLEARRAGTDLLGKALTAMERPAYLVGTKENPDIRATRIATVDAFLKRHGGDLNVVERDPEFQKEIERIEELQKLTGLNPQTGTKP